ncbi:MAG: hypothetical protein KBT31_04500 [Firmicutes bacterium]|nr:hypothetical protein [Candidatus Colimorpha enterica]
MFKKKENNTLEILLKVFLAVGILAGIAVIAKILYDKYQEKLDILNDEGFDCNFECLDNDDLDCDCDTCIYNKSCTEAAAEDAVEAVEEAVEEAAEAVEEAAEAIADAE